MKRYSRHQIEELLDKFMDGQTSVEEEAQLADYFRSDDVPAEWEDYRLMFNYFDHGMEGDPVPVHQPRSSLTKLVGHRWWGIAAAACITAAIVGTVVLHRPTQVAQPPETPVIAHRIDTIASPPTAETEPQQLVSATQINPTHPLPRSARRLKAENKRLVEENERLQRELDDLKRRSFIIDLEAMGYKTVLNEDGNIVLIDLEQEIENELNNQPTTNIPAL